MVQLMKVGSSMIKQKVKADLSILMVTFTKVVGFTIWPTVMEPTPIAMVQNMLVNGKMTSSTVKEKRHGPTVPVLKAPMLTVPKRVKAHSSGTTVTTTQGLSKTIKSKVKVSTTGRMVDALKVNGSTIRSMVTVYSHGPTAESMKVVTSTTKKKDWATSTGPTAAPTKVDGKMESRTGRAPTHPKVERCALVSGRMANG